MTRIGNPFCTLDGQSTIGALPSSRSLSLAAAKILDNEATAPANAFVPNLLALNFFQFIVHETTQGNLMGSVFGENGTAACGLNGRLLPKSLSSQYADGLEVNFDDKFYKKFGVQCLNFLRNKVLNEKCNIQKSNFVSVVY